MQNNYIIYENKYIQDSVYLWGMKGGGKEKATQRVQLHSVLLLFKKKNLKQIEENVKIQEPVKSWMDSTWNDFSTILYSLLNIWNTSYPFRIYRDLNCVDSI